jgi:pyridoxal phosphate enzyme (YggS family)
MSPYETAWQAVHARIALAARAAGRPPDDVRLLAVSKAMPAGAIEAVHALGQRAFGENYVQEAVGKRSELAGLMDIEWHLIGPLQSNKARAAAAAFDWVESVDRLKIAERLAAARDPARGALNVLIQVNASGEVTKSGVSPPETVGLALAVAALPGLRVRGIMGIPEPTEDPVRQRGQFALLRECYEALQAAGLAVDTLSMGMSGDLEAAIAQGATQVRVGTAVFGPRPAADA